MKKSLILLGAAAVLCAGFGRRPAQQETTAPPAVPAASEDAERIRVTLPSRAELEQELSVIGKALARLADAVHIERIPVPGSDPQPPA